MSEPIIVPHPRTRKRVTLSQLADEVGLHSTTLLRRYRAGLRGEDLIAQPKAAQLSISEAKRKAHRRAQSEQRERVTLGWRWYARQFDSKAKVVMAPTLGDVGQQWSKSLQEIMGA